MLEPKTASTARFKIEDKWRGLLNMETLLEAVPSYMTEMHARVNRTGFQHCQTKTSAALMRVKQGSEAQSRLQSYPDHGLCDDQQASDRRRPLTCPLSATSGHHGCYFLPFSETSG